jgi:hypothetical protein
MKKALLIMSLVVVVGALVAGLVFPASAVTGPSLHFMPNSSNPNFTFSFSGNNWSMPGTNVDLYLDEIDPVQQVASVAVGPKGNFMCSVVIPATTLGAHQMLAKQGSNEASVTFTVKTTTPPDVRSQGLLNDIQGQVKSPEYGLAEIKAEVSAIQDDIADLKSNRAGVPLMAVESGSYTITDDREKDEVYHSSYDQLRHVSVTLEYEGLSAQNSEVAVLAKVGNNYGGIADWSFNAGYPESGTQTFDINTDEWYIVVWHTSGETDLAVDFNATTTYLPAE